MLEPGLVYIWFTETTPEEEEEEELVGFYHSNYVKTLMMYLYYTYLKSI